MNAIFLFSLPIPVGRTKKVGEDGNRLKHFVGWAHRRRADSMSPQRQREKFHAPNYFSSRTADPLAAHRPSL
jgi:hypothetical protein